MRTLWIFVAAILLATTVNAQPDFVNLDHLRHLTESVTIDGRAMAIVHIYAEYPDYEWVGDSDEGISAVDDVARAAIVYLWEYERTGQTTNLDSARQCLDFVRYMQADDGEFYNFVTDRSGTINQTGGTSFKSLGWWAMRALWALGEGVRVFDTVDPAYADELSEAYLKTEAALSNTLGNYGQTTNIHGFEVPAWIPGGESTVASVGLLGLSAYYQARPNRTTADSITKIADGIAAYRLGTDSEYPFGTHPARANAPGFWHNWGAHMPHALVMAGMALDRQDWIESAAAANSFLLRHLAFEPFRHIGVVPYRLEQIAYGTNMLVQAYAALYQATGDEQYARYAGLAASWYFGNNMAGVPMYDPATGRTFDGINGPVSWRVNRNSGAESTIEGLMSMIAVARSGAQDYLQLQTVSGNSFRVLQAEDGERVIGTPVYFTGDWTGEGYVSGGRYVGLGEGQRMRLTFEIEPEQADDYLLYVAHVRQSASSSSFSIPYTSTPPTIDGDWSEWTSDALTLESNTQRQFLRGAGLWQGENVDSHTVRLQWDETNLYILAVVRDPQHEQAFTLSNVWQGDTLWLYFANAPDARSLSAKFTLAETPDGPQIWDWTETGFARGAALRWRADGGANVNQYIYEAAIPWAAIEVENPQSGTRIGFEAGRGIGGNAFMDLTGRDPDVVANLLQLTLVTPETTASAAATPNVALAVRLDGEEEHIIPQTVSPDSDYFWLDRVPSMPITLEVGEHTIRFEYAGEEGTANPGLSKIDAFYLQPAVARRTFAHPDGRTIILTYNTLTGEATWDESLSS
jgi:hypothetical protein